MSTQYATWIPFSEELAHDFTAGKLVGALISTLLLRRWYAEAFRESLADPIARLELGADVRWDSIVWGYDDDEEDTVLFGVWP